MAKLGYGTVGSNRLNEARNFYDALLGSAGLAPLFEHPSGGRIYGKDGNLTFGVLGPYDGKPATVGNGSMFAFNFASRKEVDEFHARALALGGKDEGAPGERGPKLISTWRLDWSLRRHAAASCSGTGHPPGYSWETSAAAIWDMSSGCSLSRGSRKPTALWIWLILGGVFFVDATVTLIRRTVRGDRVFEAHRTHAYQWLARRWGGHLPVTLAVLGTNLFWLLPWALLAASNASWAAWIALIALLPLALVMVALGAGPSGESTVGCAGGWL